MNPLLCSSAAPVIAPVGIPRTLAAERARRLTEIRYHLSFLLDKNAPSAIGHERLSFVLQGSPAPLLLDFREGVASHLVLNGRVYPIESEAGHIKLPKEGLRSGGNLLTLDFTAPVAAAGKAITRFEDKDDGSVYLYTLFVPMDASMAFPCFDQPDLKARFTLTVSAPAGWNVISNTRSDLIVTNSHFPAHVFDETEPISTYLFAFAAGPFERVHSASGLPDVYVRRSQVKRSEPEVPAIQDITAKGIQFLSGYFAQPFPFPKYDMVLIPGFPYGGMEHAGATFLNEDAMLFRLAPTETDRFNRSVTLLHELAHQWFGDFTTMRWFDDLWLKEGFAQYMAYRTMASLAPEADVWMRFYSQIKPAAYSTDQTKGTTPIYQDIPNLLDAKSAYGAIVYSKAPGLLRQLEYLVGEDNFRQGLRTYLHEHPYGNAQWSDLVHAFEASSGQNLGPWAQAWIHHRGLPVVTAEWSCGGGNQLTHLTVRQRDALSEGSVWPFATEVLLGYSDGTKRQLRVSVSGTDTSVASAIGRPCPAFVFANNDDHAYGIFLPDRVSRGYLLKHVGSISAPFARALFWGALWESVQYSELAPVDYLAAVIDDVGAETNEVLLRSLAGRATVTLHRYLNDRTAAQWTPRFEALAGDRAFRASQPGLRILWFRALTSLADTPAGLQPLKDLLSGKQSIPGVQLRSLDRWSIVATLLAHSDSEASRLFDAEQTRDHTGEGLKYAYVVGAAPPDAQTKQRYFADYRNTTSHPEDWIEASLGPFNSWNQTAITLPFLEPALAAVGRMKRERKIFFVLAWLNAFIGGQKSAEADETVHRWLAGAELDRDLQLKVLQSLDELDRTVKIRRTFP